MGAGTGRRGQQAVGSAGAPVVAGHGLAHPVAAQVAQVGALADAGFGVARSPASMKPAAAR